LSQCTRLTGGQTDGWTLTFHASLKNGHVIQVAQYACFQF